MALVRTAPTAMRLPSGPTVDVPTYLWEVVLWTGDASLAPNYNRNPKPVVDHDGMPMFPELAMLRMLEDEGWKGVWIDNFGGRILRAWSHPPMPVQLAPEQMAILARIPQRSGRWDIFAWRSDEVRFVELKGTWRKGRDHIRDSQRNWLDAALKAGFHVTDFALVEWTIRSDRPAGA